MRDEDEKRGLMHQFLERGEGEGDVFVDVDNVALFMLVMSFLGTANMNIKHIANIRLPNIQHKFLVSQGAGERERTKRTVHRDCC